MRQQGGRGLSCVFAVPHPSTSEAAAAAQNTVLEKAGVNISVVHGTLPQAAVKQMRADHGSMASLEGSLPFFAAGISLVIHPRKPHAPTRRPRLKARRARWFGGGSDLTPSYLYEKDARHFYATLMDACAPHGSAIYPTFKIWLAASGESSSTISASLGEAFVPSYLPIIERRMPSDEHARRWRLLRRGRYVEFNLVYDRGTRFGMLTPGVRIESVLMSLLETERWDT
ncbi:predicted protein [Postia placenta Mad-698-R]|nr:predicted protein [Postia placenta Mad-698-R]